MKNLESDFEIAYVLVQGLVELDPVVAISAVCTVIERQAKRMGKDKIEVAVDVLTAIKFAPEVDEE